MAEDEKREKNPVFEFKTVKVGETQKIKLDSGKPIASGENSYGHWCLWPAYVENTTVKDTRENGGKPINSYTGKVIFFPPRRLHSELEQLANGNTGVEIEISAEAIEVDGKLSKKYNLKKLSDGEPSQASLTPSEGKLIKDAQELMKEGYGVTEDIFVKTSQSPQYTNISEERARELFKTAFSK